MKTRFLVLLAIGLAVLAIFGCGEEETEDDIGALIVQLNDSNDEVRRAAVVKLAKINNPDAVPALMKALSDEEEDIRSIAADALAKMGEPAVPALIRALGSEDTKVRRSAVRVLGDIGEPAKDAVPALAELLSDDYCSIGKEVAIALKKIGTPEAKQALYGTSDDYFGPDSAGSTDYIRSNEPGVILGCEGGNCAEDWQDNGILQVVPAWPNPMRLRQGDLLQIWFTLLEPAQVIIRVRGPLGPAFKRDLGHLLAGHHKFSWSGRDDCGNQVENGIYRLFIIAKGSRVYGDIKVEH